MTLLTEQKFARNVYANILFRSTSDIVINKATGQDGYVVDLDKSKLEKAPTYKASSLPNWSDREYGNRIDAYYGVPPYWGMML